MKKQMAGALSLVLVLCVAMAGCGGSGQTAAFGGETSSMPQTQSSGSMESASQTASQEEASSEPEASVPVSEPSELIVRFGDGGDPYTMALEDNSTADAIAGYVGSSDWRLPIYSYDESDVMQYYDIPRRYEIPDNSEAVLEAHAGDVFYSAPNRIVLYYHDAVISEEYTKIGTFEATDAWVAAVEENPVLEGWGNKIVQISSPDESAGQ